MPVPDSPSSITRYQFIKLPFDSHYLTLSGGLRYHYVDEQRYRNADRNIQEREVLLFVHGNPTWSFYWRNIIKAFRDRFRCIAVDHIGCGLSDKPKESEYPFTLQRRIDDLCRLIETLDLKHVTLVAHDWGGAIGTGAAVKMPERFDRFVFLNTAAFRSEYCPLRIRLCRIPFLGRWMIQGLNLFALAALWTASAKRLPQDVRQGLLFPYNNWHNRTAVYRFVQDIPLSPHHSSYETLKNIEETLPLFREKPVCLIWGMLDWCFSPEYLKRFLQFFPEANVCRIADAHHLVVEDAPDETVQAIEGFILR
ncbi:MAG: alpha/beta fold hydrolase [Planctomycetaceae bacterium]|nr:alpha/beta fold hydrolase [Planctomycetaceae bacterium]